MTLEQLIYYKRTSTKIVVNTITHSTKECIFSGYERNICNEVTSEFMEFLEKYKKYHVHNYGIAIDKNGIPYIDILVYE